MENDLTEAKRAEGTELTALIFFVVLFVNATPFPTAAADGQGSICVLEILISKLTVFRLEE